MTDRAPTHGPWTGLDFDPTADLNRTAALCPDGWLEVFWDTNEEPARLRPVRAFAVDLSAPDDYESALEQGPIHFGLEDWPHGRMFIAKLSYERDGDGFVVVGDLLTGPHGPAYADVLPERTEVTVVEHFHDGEPPRETVVKIAELAAFLARPDVLGLDAEEAGSTAEELLERGRLTFEGDPPITIKGREPSWWKERA